MKRVIQLLKAIRAAALTSTLGCMLGATAAPILHISNEGKLLGADKVLVEGQLYSVRFQDGRCADLYNGCDENPDFPFATAEIAIQAGQALLDQVFLDIDGIGMFDSDHALTQGCVTNSRSRCVVVTPWRRSSQSNAISLTAATNYEGAGDSAGRFGTTTPLRDFGEIDFETWAIWSVSTGDDNEVPLPGSLALFGAGLGALWIEQRRQRRNRE